MKRGYHVKSVVAKTYPSRIAVTRSRYARRCDIGKGGYCSLFGVERTKMCLI
jgi:hypothetical protein